MKRIGWYVINSPKITLFFLVFAINLFVAVQLKMLHISTDEFGVLASAAYFSGKDWSLYVSNIAYYGYGQALIYTPLFMLIKDPFLLYTSLLVVNSIEVSLIPVIIYTILDKYLRVPDRKSKFLISLVISLYPFYFIYSKWAYYEALMGLLPWIIALVITIGISNQSKKTKLINGAILGMLLSFGYATHNRFIGIIAATLITMAVFHIIKKRSLVDYKSFIFVFAGGMCADLLVKQYLYEHLWLIGEGKQLGNTFGSVLSKMSVFLSADGFIGMIKGLFGQLFYASSSAMGMALLSILICMSVVVVYLAKKRYQENDDDVFFIITFFATTAFLISLVISIVFLTPGIISPTGRGDYFIYGRYFDHVIGLLLFPMLYCVSSKKITKFMNYGLFCFAIYLVLSGFVIFLLADEILSRANIANLPILGITPYIGENPRDFIREIHFGTLALVVSIVFGLLMAAIKNRKLSIFFAILCCVFMYTNIQVANAMIIPNAENNYSEVREAEEVFSQFGDIYKKYSNVYYVSDNQKKPWSDSRYQFVLANYKIILYKGEWDRIPEGMEENSFIISPYDLDLHHQSIYKLSTSDTENIWIYGNGLYEELKRFF